MSVSCPTDTALSVPALPPIDIALVGSTTFAVVNEPPALTRLTVPKSFGCVVRSAVIGFVFAVKVVVPETMSGAVL